MNRTRNHLRIFKITLGIATLTAATSFGQPANSVQFPPNQAISAADCTAQRLGATIPVSAIGEPVSAVSLSQPVWTEPTANLPAYCSVDGQMAPIDKSGLTPPIKFRVVLPASWSSLAVQLGGGGMNGVVPRLAGPQTAAGFATYGSDSGHSNEPDWALSDEAMRNLGYMQLKKTHDAAMVLIVRMYGVKPRLNYFVGASQGGREALTVVQRYPNDYDGISAGVPIVNFSSLMLGPQLIRIQEKPLENWVPATKGNAVAAEFIRQCDKLDGLADGIINNYVACRSIFNVHQGAPNRHPWAAKRCPNNVDPNPKDDSVNACFTDGQISTLEFIFSSYNFDTPLANGVQSFGMWTPTTDGFGRNMARFFQNMPRPPAAAAPSGAAPPAMPPSPGPARPPVSGAALQGLLAATRFRGQEGAAPDAPLFAHMGSLGVTGFLLKDLKANSLDYVEGGTYNARRIEISQILDSTNPDLTAFFKRGGKMIVTIGTGDTIASPGSQLDYFQAVLEKMGRPNLDSFARFFVIPEAGHGLSGYSFYLNGDGKKIEETELPHQFDSFALLRDWVEQNKAPGMSEVVTSKNASLPLCSYPAYPRYVSGDTSLAASYTCAQP